MIRLNSWFRKPDSPGLPGTLIRGYLCTLGGYPQDNLSLNQRLRHLPDHIPVMIDLYSVGTGDILAGIDGK